MSAPFENQCFQYPAPDLKYSWGTWKSFDFLGGIQKINVFHENLQIYKYLKVEIKFEK